MGPKKQFKEMIRGFEAITDGHADDLPEQAFLYFGGIDNASIDADLAQSYDQGR